MLKWAVIFLILPLSPGFLVLPASSRPPPPSRNGCSASSWCCSSAHWLSAWLIGSKLMS